MNNKSDKKHKPKPKTKKKTASHQSKKKNEIKTGGAGWFKGLFSGKTGSYNSKTQPPANSRTLSPNVLPVNSNNSQPQPHHRLHQMRNHKDLIQLNQHQDVLSYNNSFLLSQSTMFSIITSRLIAPSIAISGLTGLSYGSLIPVNSLMTPFLAKA